MFLLLTTDFLDATHPPTAGGKTIYGHREQELTTHENFLGSRELGGGAVRVSFSMFYQRKQRNLGNRGHTRLILLPGSE